MAAAITDRVRHEAAMAAHLSALCFYLSQALGNDPDTSLAGEAVEGLEKMADNLAASLHAIADESASR